MTYPRTGHAQLDELVTLAATAADGDSNDAEIALLQSALAVALSLVPTVPAVPTPEGKSRGYEITLVIHPDRFAYGTPDAAQEVLDALIDDVNERAYVTSVQIVERTA